jgi:hypothetical protein
MTRVKNWGKFQHFKDRRPPWIKLYRDILDDVEWHDLSGDDAKALVMLWLIASEHGGVLPSVRALSFRLRQSEEYVKSLIMRLEHWLEPGDIATISGGYQSDRQETETETETETDRPARKRADKEKAPRVTVRKRLPPDWKPSASVEAQLHTEGFSLFEIQNQVPRFRDYWTGQGKPMADWDATFRNWVRRSNEFAPKGSAAPLKFRGNAAVEYCKQQAKELRDAHEPDASVRPLRISDAKGGGTGKF